jgi:hypothetical protein
MASVTYYVALPIAVNHEGDFVALEAEEVQSSVGACRWAKSSTANQVAAAAFSRSCSVNRRF